jgi:glutamate carboxypeptidase
MVEKAIAIYKEVGGELGVVPTSGGGTDAAYAALGGKPVIESLGLPGFGYHSNQAEYVLIDAIPAPPLSGRPHDHGPGPGKVNQHAVDA